MRRVNEDLLRHLAGHDAQLCLSLYLEVAPGGGEHDRTRIALKNAKAAAEEAVAEAGAKVGADGEAASALRDRLAALDYDDLVGSHEGHVAVFVAPGLTETVTARIDESSVECGRHFRLAPLVAALDQTPDHAILYATEGRAALYGVHGGEMIEDDADGLPRSLDEFTRFSQMQEKGNIKGREDAGTPHHSMGGHDWRQDHEQDYRRYADALANAVGRHLAGSNMPLLIAADERLFGAIRERSEYPYLIADRIAANPDRPDMERIGREAAGCLEHAAETRRAEAWDKVAQSLGRGDREASEDPAEIAGAAAAGRVAHLFARTGGRLPGRFDRDSLSAEAAEDGPEDLVDLAIVETLRNGGEVFPLGARGSGKSPLAAAYRYPT